MKRGFGNNSTGDVHVPEDSAEVPSMDETPVCSPRIASRAAGMYVGQATIGMAHALIGTTLLELQIQTGADIEQLALLVTWSNLGRLISSFTVGAIFDRLHPEMQLSLALLLSCLTSLSIPFSNTYPGVAVLMGVQGLATGYLSSGSTAYSFQLWKAKNGPFLQALLCCFSLGGALGPPIAQPFLTKSCENTTVVESSTVESLLDEVNIHRLRAMPTDDSGSFIASNYQSVQCPHNTPFTDQYDLHPGVFYPYVILAIMQGITSVYFAVLFTFDRCRPFRKKSSLKVDSSESTNIRSHLLLIVLTSTMLFCSIGVETTVNSLLYTYAVKHLGWSTVSANNLATAYWASFAGSRALSIAHAKYLKPEAALGVFIGMMFSAFGVMAALSSVDPLVMWVCIPLLGLAMSAQMGNMFMMAGNFFNISGRISGVFMAALYAGGMVHPALTGYLFEEVDMQWYMYIQVVSSVIMVVVFIVIIMKGRKYTKAPLVLATSAEIQSLSGLEIKDVGQDC